METLWAGRILTPKRPIATMCYWIGLVTSQCCAGRIGGGWGRAARWLANTVNDGFAPYALGKVVRKQRKQFFKGFGPFQSAISWNLKILNFPSVLAEHAEYIVHWKIILIFRLSANRSITYGTDRQCDCYNMKKVARCDTMGKIETDW